MSNFSRVLRDQALRRPDAVAVIYEDRRTTYAELDRKVDAVAQVLQELGIGAGDRVAIVALNSDTFLHIAFATWRVGAVLVPLNHRLQVQETAYLLEHSGARAVFAETGFADLVDAALAGRSGEVKRVAMDAPVDGWTSLTDALPAAPEAVADCARTMDDVQRIMYTSGTTSRPKGVIVTHGMATWNVLIQTIELGLDEHEKVLISSPLYHIAALDAPGLAALAVGGTLVVCRRFDAGDVWRAIREERVTGGIMVASMLHRLKLDDAAGDGASMRYLIFGIASRQLYDDIRSMFPSTRLIQAYGLTECCSGVTYMDALHLVEKRGSAGPALPFLEVAVLDPEGRPLPPGTPGEIAVRGPKTTPGYWRDPQETEQLLRGGWLHTGDAGTLDEDGYLVVTDRIKDMIRSGGENVASLEIEAVLYEHPAVHEAAVVGRPDAAWGEVPRAFVVLKPRREVSEAELVAHCRAQLAGFKTPKEVVLLASLPRNESGKVLKRDLRQWLPPVSPELIHESES